MHPCRTALIGLLCLGVATAHNNCDQHASQQATYESANYIAAPSNQFTGYATKTETRGSGVFGSGGGTYQQQGLQNQNPSGENPPFWWMNSNASPFKAQGCDSANGCVGQTNTVQLEKDGYAKMDLSKNIFINKNFGALGSSSNQKSVNVAATNSLIGAGGSTPTGFAIHSQSEFGHSTGSEFNNAGNPFLIKAAGGSTNQYQTTGAASNNAYQTESAYQNGGSSSFGSNSVSNGYGQVNADRGYLPPKETVTCSGPGKVCASKQVCVNGYVYDNLVGSSNGVSHLFIYHCVIYKKKISIKTTFSMPNSLKLMFLYNLFIIFYFITKVNIHHQPKKK